MLLLAACFAVGLLCRPWWQPLLHAVLMSALLLVVACVAWLRAPRLAWFATGTAWIALGWAAGVTGQVHADGTLLRYADGLQRTLHATVTGMRVATPRPASLYIVAADPAHPVDEETAFAEHDSNRVPLATADLDADAIEDLTPDLAWMQPVHGGVRATLLVPTATDAARRAAMLSAWSCGAHVSVAVRLHPPQRYNDPGVWQYAEALEANGIVAASNADPGKMSVLGSEPASWRCRFTAAQHWAAERLQQLTGSGAMRHMPVTLRLTSDDAAMLGAMLFGDRTLLHRDLRTAFERTGSFHLFVVAGMHVALLLALLYSALERLRVPRVLAALLALLVTTGYALLTGWGAPVQRALLMSAVYLLVRLLSRERHALNALGAAVLAMLVLQPGALHEAGFQMTVLAVVAIAGLAAPLLERTLLPYARALHEIALVRLDARLPPRLAQFRVSLRWIGQELLPRRNTKQQRPLWVWVQRLPSYVMRALLAFAELLVVTLVAEAVLALPMALYFHRATPFAAPANLLALPLAGVMMVSGLLTFLLSLMHPSLAVPAAMGTALLLHGTTAIIAHISALHGADVRMPGPIPSAIAAALALWAAAVYLLRQPARRTGFAACALLPLALLLILWPRRPVLHSGMLEFTAIDVGQGDSLLVAAPGGATMLIDAGGPTGSAAMTDTGGFDIGEEVVSPYLWSRGLRRLDVLALTHAHSDHIGGMGAVLRNFRPRELWVSIDADTPAFRSLLDEARHYRVTVRHIHAGDAIPWSGTSINVLSPSPAYRARAVPTNDDSLVLRIAYGRASVLAEGDAEHASEDGIVAAQPAPVTLLKVGHHGSNTSTEEMLLNRLHPMCAVISCGRGNRFGHPRMPVLQRLQAAGIRTARTDTMGAVQYLLTQDGRIETHVLASNP